MKSTLNVFFTIDKNYIIHFTIALTSLLENNKDINFEIFVIHDISKPGELNLIKEFIYKRYKLTLNFLSLDTYVFDKYKINLHVSKATYFRLLLVDILPISINKGLFLDSDLVVTGSVKELADYKFGSELLLASDDVELEENIARINELGNPATVYFNAGVMLINLKAWRENEVTKQLIKIADKYMDRLKWWDQDVLNMYFYDKWKYFDSKFNAIHLKYKLPETPVIIHYAGVSKPWEYTNENPYKDEYWKYLKLTPFKRDYKLLKKYYFKKGNFKFFLVKVKRKIEDTFNFKFYKSGIENI